MTNYQLNIRDANIQAHIDIADEVATKKNGLLTFTVRVNDGNIVDLNVTEYVPVKERYGIIKALVIEEVTVELPSSLDSGKRSEVNALRPNNLYRGSG